MTTPSMLAKLTIRNASLLTRTAPIGTGVSELQPISTRYVCNSFYVYVIIMHGMCKFTHKKNSIHIGAMTTPTMLVELTMLARAAPILMIVFELQQTSTRFAMVFFI